MSNWNTFPKGAWTSIGKVLSGFGPGEGSYETSYMIDTSTKPFLNGRVSAAIRLAEDQPITGAGVIARADDLRSFLAFYVATDDTEPNLYSVCLTAFKLGRPDELVTLKHPISIPNHKFHIALQFFSGDIVGQVLTETKTYTLPYSSPQPPFPGHGGVIRFYNTSVIAQSIHIEEITMKPILPEEQENKVKQPQPFGVFLSHSSLDKVVVLKVIEAFKQAGIKYWVDHEQISFGDGIVAKIEEGLQKSQYVVVCLSENLVTSGWCRAEYGPILYREFSGDTTRRVIPLSLDGSKNNDAIPLLLSDKMRADFTDQNNFSAFIKFLRDSKPRKDN